MKTKLLILLFIGFFSYHGIAQVATNTVTDSLYAIINVSSPQYVFGLYQIKIYYGNGKIEEFKYVEFERKNRDPLINEIANALNYMVKKGYILKQTITFSVPTPEIQYIMERKP